MDAGSTFGVVAHSISVPDLLLFLVAPGCAEFLQSHVHIYLAWSLCFLELLRTLLLNSNKRRKWKNSYMRSISFPTCIDYSVPSTILSLKLTLVQSLPPRFDKKN